LAGDSTSSSPRHLVAEPAGVAVPTPTSLRPQDQRASWRTRCHASELRSVEAQHQFPRLLAVRTKRTLRPARANAVASVEPASPPPTVMASKVTWTEPGV
jgi:hypothetical protein